MVICIGIDSKLVALTSKPANKPIVTMDSQNRVFQQCSVVTNFWPKKN